ncbi:MAG TPA: L-threonylcarbamoyladenylate synthase [Stellaceae bacterium]|nr:L-threonylcarbamoyladenylate synthase [Stellaceae bacterium]
MTLRLGPHELDEAARLIRAGELVAFPTETVYGLGGDATNDRAVAAIFAAKDRPRINPLIVHVADAEAAAALAHFDDRAATLAARFWPGPLSLVLRRRADCPVSLLACAGLDTVALRVPAQETARHLIRAAGTPIAAPSANRSGRVSPTTADHVAAELDGRIAAILDGGPCRIGLESTVLELAGGEARLLRPGGLALEAIEALIGPIARGRDTAGVLRSPGMLGSHYAPSLPLRLAATSVAADEALIAFGGNVPPGAARMIQLSATGDVTEAAANLFAALRALDRADYRAIAVMPIPEIGLGLAINDRLRRAAAPRPALAGEGGAR